ncbi:MAG: NUDIX hydrolase [Myxococcota bacterium]|jgi:8-oxo-dGTP pyrophosphatase MutT (NUDIX family)|nr:NUDIX hydrolase [Myxococcota bacterium]
MHRQSLLSLLRDYRSHHPGEGPCVDRIVSLVEGHSDCFERTCLPGHITASSWIVDEDGKRALLTHHRKLELWLQLGGHADGDTDICRVALREAREESGMAHFEVLADGFPIDIDVHDIPARPGEPAHQHHDFRFLLRARPGQPLVISEESKDLRWFARDELAPLLGDESIGRMVRKADVLLGKAASAQR